MDNTILTTTTITYHPTYLPTYHLPDAPRLHATHYAGPALTTAGNPGATSDSIFAVGAYVTDSMMRTCYSMPKGKTDGYNTNFTWTSVGRSKIPLSNQESARGH